MTRRPLRRFALARLAGVALLICLTNVVSAAGDEMLVCIGGAASLEDVRCFLRDRTDLGIDPAEEPQHFAASWQAEQNVMVVLNSIEPRSRKLVLEGDAREKIDLIIEIPPPAELISFSLIAEDANVRLARVDLSGGERHRILLTSLAPEPLYKLRLEAHGFVPWETVLDRPQGESPRVLTARMRRHPLVTGRVVDHTTLLPLGGAVITIGEKELVTLADGIFGPRVDPAQWPAAFEVELPGYGRQPFELPQRISDLDLGDLHLSRAGRIKVTIMADLDGELRLYEFDKSTGAGSVDPARGVEPLRVEQTRAPETEIENVAPGEYVLMLAGDGPLQRFAERVTVKPDDVSEIALEPVRAPVTISVRDRDGTRIGARLSAIHRSRDWRTAVEVGSEPSTFECWQLGEYRLYVSAQGSSLFTTSESVTSKDGGEWEIEVSGIAVDGMVADADKGAPVQDATVLVRHEHAQGASTSVLKTGAEGHFVVPLKPPGTMTLTVSAQGYAEEEKRLVLAEGSSDQSVTFRLEPLTHRRVRFVDHNGSPLPGIAVLAVDATYPVYADPVGVATLEVAPGKPREFVAIPREGSFTVLRLDGSEPETQTVTVPRGDVEIVIRTETKDGEGIAHIPLAIRYEGVPIPWAAMELLREQQGVVWRTGPLGVARIRFLPPGLYEIWPVPGPSRDVPSTSPPVVLPARPGVNDVVFTLERVRTD